MRVVNCYTDALWRSYFGNKKWGEGGGGRQASPTRLVAAGKTRSDYCVRNVVWWNRWLTWGRSRCFSLDCTVWTHSPALPHHSPQDNIKQPASPDLDRTPNTLPAEVMSLEEKVFHKLSKVNVYSLYISIKWATERVAESAGSRGGQQWRLVWSPATVPQGPQDL